MLRIQNISTGYGDIAVLKNISLHISRGEIVTLIGANGAGKTTLLNTICGIVRARSGSIIYNDQPISACSADRIVRLGISQVPEGRQIFAPLSVLDNLRLGAYVRYSDWGTKKVQEQIERMYALFPRLHERRQQYAGTLSGGEQQMLAIGRAVMAHPKLVLVDEASLGLSPILTRAIFDLIVTLNQQGTTVLLVEQNIHLALKICQMAYVMKTGSVVISGPGEELLANEEVRKAYIAERGSRQK
jgi:branched-chain amino acid transport system ATP-binding protein